MANFYVNFDIWFNNIFDPKIGNEKIQPLTHATTDLGNWLNGKLVLYLG